MLLLSLFVGVKQPQVKDVLISSPLRVFESDGFFKLSMVDGCKFLE